MKRICMIILCFVLCLCSCSDVYRYTSTEFYSMTTFVNVISDGDGNFDNVENYAKDFENRISRTKSDSEIARLNKDGSAVLSEDTLSILKKSLEIAVNTDGAFNPCLGTLSELWDITSGKEYVPDKGEIETALKNTSYEEVKIEGNKVTLPKGMKIDLGGVAKGYALQKMVEIESSEKDANVCVSIGGNVGVRGSSKANRENNKEGWNVGITTPFDKNELSGTLTLTKGFVSVSGAYERFFEKDGKVYHHIFDSKTGYPAQSDIASAAVINNDGLEGDALSTALFVMGSTKAIEFYKENKYNFDMILVLDDGDILITKGIKDKFTVNSSAKGIKSDIKVID